MPDFFSGPATAEPVALHVAHVALRLVLAAVLGVVVAWIYRRTRKSTEVVTSFPTTLVLLCTLIAMVTQVIGDSVARAFSLVGALSIVRFRTVVRDTQDTAYVIFAVAVGMAVGAQAPWVGLVGLAIVGITAFFLRSSRNVASAGQPPFVVIIRIPLGYELEKLQSALEPFVLGRELTGVETTKQGAALNVTYEVKLKTENSANELVRALNRTEGVQSVELQKRVDGV
jgi:energy-converting hydrogenase Eha subunit A